MVKERGREHVTGMCTADLIMVSSDLTGMFVYGLTLHNVKHAYLVL